MTTNKTNLIAFGTGIGLPAPFKVAYDGASKSLKDKPKSGGGIEKRPLCCKLISADLKMKVFFSIEEGSLCGFECDCGDLEKLPQEELSMPSAPDGYVKIVGCNSLFAPEVNFVIFKKPEVRYDAKGKIIAIGSIGDDDAVFRICENMCLGVGESGSLTGFIIKI